MRPAFFLLLATLPGALSAQVSIEAGPRIGSYMANANVVERVIQSLGATTEMQLRHHDALLVGGRGTAWLHDIVGIEGDAWLVMGEVGLLEGGARRVADGRLLVLSVRGIARIPGFPLHVTLGPALLSRWGEAYRPWGGGRSSVAVAHGVGARVRLSPAVALRLDADRYLYSVTLFERRTGNATEASTQRDLVITGGLAFQVDTIHGWRSLAGWRPSAWLGVARDTRMILRDISDRGLQIAAVQATRPIVTVSPVRLQYVIAAVPLAIVTVPESVNHGNAFGGGIIPFGTEVVVGGSSPVILALHAEAGAMYFSRDMPVEGSGHVSFLWSRGAGVGVRLSDLGTLRGGYRRIHLSNGGLAFPNVGLNANVWYLGWSR